MLEIFEHPNRTSGFKTEWLPLSAPADCMQEQGSRSGCSITRPGVQHTTARLHHSGETCDGFTAEGTGRKIEKRRCGGGPQKGPSPTQTHRGHLLQDEGDDRPAERRVIAEVLQVAAVLAGCPDRHLCEPNQREHCNCKRGNLTC